MKIGDIKIEALRLMFALIEGNMTAETLTDYEQSDTVGDYLAAMPGSINRALADITSRRILPEKRHVLTLADGQRLMSAYRFDLSQIDDFYDVSRVIAETHNGYDGNYPFRMEGRTLVLLAPDDSATFTLLYYPKLAPVGAWANTHDLDIPDEIASVIPYFLKGEIYREDEIGDAAEAMSWYEQRLAALDPHRTEKQDRVVSTYSQVLL